MFEALYHDYLDACDELGITPLSRGEPVALIYELLAAACDVRSGSVVRI